MFEIKMQKQKIESLNKIIQLKDRQLKQMGLIIDNYHKDSLKNQRKWFESPFMDVIYYLAGFITAIIIKSLSG